MKKFTFKSACFALIITSLFWGCKKYETCGDAIYAEAASFNIKTAAYKKAPTDAENKVLTKSLSDLLAKIETCADTKTDVNLIAALGGFGCSFDIYLEAADVATKALVFKQIPPTRIECDALKVRVATLYVKINNCADAKKDTDLINSLNLIDAGLTCSLIPMLP